MEAAGGMGAGGKLVPGIESGLALSFTAGGADGVMVNSFAN